MSWSLDHGPGARRVCDGPSSGSSRGKRKDPLRLKPPKGGEGTLLGTGVQGEGVLDSHRTSDLSFWDCEDRREFESHGSCSSRGASGWSKSVFSSLGRTLLSVARFLVPDWEGPAHDRVGVLPVPCRPTPPTPPPPRDRCLVLTSTLSASSSLKSLRSRLPCRVLGRRPILWVRLGEGGWVIRDNGKLKPRIIRYINVPGLETSSMILFGRREGQDMGQEGSPSARIVKGHLQKERLRPCINNYGKTSNTVSQGVKRKRWIVVWTLEKEPYGPRGSTDKC